MTTIAQRLRLADEQVTRTRRRRIARAELGQVRHEDPGLIFLDRAGNTITVRMYLEDGQGGPRHRYKIIWTTTEDGNAALHQHAAGVYEHVKKVALFAARKEQRIRALLYLAGVRVN